MNSNTCKTQTNQRRKPMFAPSIHNIVKEMLQSSPSEIVFKKNIQYNKPPVNVSQSKEVYHLEMALPGIKKKDLDIKVEDKLLIISSNVEKTKERNFRLREFDYSVFTRKFHLPKDVDAESITAAFSKGILKISLKKKEQIQRTITVK